MSMSTSTRTRPPSSVASPYRLLRTAPPPALPLVPDEAQREVLAHAGGPLLVLAGPGTGKTTTLVEAVARRGGGGPTPDQGRGLAVSPEGGQGVRGRPDAGPGAGPDVQPEGGAGAARADHGTARYDDGGTERVDVPRVLLRAGARAAAARGVRRAAAAAVGAGAGRRAARAAEGVSRAGARVAGRAARVPDDSRPGRGGAGPAGPCA